jgi:hypothetical protein
MGPLELNASDYAVSSGTIRQPSVDIRHLREAFQGTQYSQMFIDQDGPL